MARGRQTKRQEQQRVHQPGPGASDPPETSPDPLSGPTRRENQQSAARDFRPRQTPRLLKMRKVLQERVHPQATHPLRVRKGSLLQLPPLRLQLQVREESQGPHQPPPRSRQASLPDRQLTTLQVRKQPTQVPTQITPIYYFFILQPPGTPAGRTFAKIIAKCQIILVSHLLLLFILFYYLQSIKLLVFCLL